jgi:pimeloyl-ACP methyl ester carboxylesterase
VTEKRFALNGEVKINYLVNEKKTNNTPLFYIPGMLGNAEEFPISAFVTRECIAISLRGRGSSDSPEKGYTFNNHIADIEAVISDSNVENFCLMAFSRGVAYALGFATQNPNVLKGLIICDYPAQYKKFGTDWVERSLSNPNAKPHVIKALFEETEEVSLWEQLQNIQCPVLVIRGGKVGSFLSEEDAEQYKNNFQSVEIVVFEDSSHSLWEPDEERFLSTIHNFLQKVDANS